LFGWRPEIGDPTAYGWVTTAIFAFAAISCCRAALRAPARERRFWIVMTVVSAFLAANKQLDLQTLLIDAAKFEAKFHGWYPQRQQLRLGFVAGLAFLAVAAVLITVVRAGNAGWSVRGAITGLSILLLFAVIRAGSFDKIAWFTNGWFGGVCANHIMEWAGALAVTVSALMAVRKR
jgi:hypothetical protein